MVRRISLVLALALVALLAGCKSKDQAPAAAATTPEAATRSPSVATATALRPLGRTTQECPGMQVTATYE